MKLTLQDALVYPLYLSLVTALAVGAAACTEQHQAQAKQEFCQGKVEPRNTTAEQDIKDITQKTLLK